MAFPFLTSKAKAHISDLGRLHIGNISAAKHAHEAHAHRHHHIHDCSDTFFHGALLPTDAVY